MRAYTVIADVPDRAAVDDGKGNFRRTVGYFDDRQTIAVARMVAGEKVAETELIFTIGEAISLAEKALSGDRRALTTPGLARILSASVALLSRVSLTAGAFEPITHGETADERSDGDRCQAAGAESADR
jgi:hypothetical protein